MHCVFLSQYPARSVYSYDTFSFRNTTNNPVNIGNRIGNRIFPQQELTLIVRQITSVPKPKHCHTRRCCEARTVIQTALRTHSRRRTSKVLYKFLGSFVGRPYCWTAAKRLNYFEIAREQYNKRLAVVFLSIFFFSTRSQLTDKRTARNTFARTQREPSRGKARNRLRLACSLTASNLLYPFHAVRPPGLDPLKPPQCQQSIVIVMMFASTAWWDTTVCSVCCGDSRVGKGKSVNANAY